MSMWDDSFNTLLDLCNKKDNIIEYYEDKFEEALSILYDLSDNPYRTKEITNDEIDKMRKFLDNFKFQEGGNRV